jgi:hypothetical protein
MGRISDAVVWKQARAQPADVKVLKQKTPYIVHATKKYSGGPPIDKITNGRDILVSLDFQLLIFPWRTPTTKSLPNRNYFLV